MEVEKVMVRVIKAPVVTKDNLGGRVKKTLRNLNHPAATLCRAEFLTCHRSVLDL